MNPILRRALNVAGQVASQALESYARRSSTGGRTKTGRRRTGGGTATVGRTETGARPEAPRRRPVPDAGPRGSVDRDASPGEQQREAASRDTSEYDVTRLGLPEFRYAPNADDQPDPGEVVWTWVPYDDDPSQGKDRPVLVLAQEGAGLVVAQLTSKDHDRDEEQEARWGRRWMDVGTGAWDSRGRPSEVRLDRLLWVDPDAVRREGAALDRERFAQVAAALRALHG